MRAAVFHHPLELSFEDRPAPEPGRGEAQIKVTAAGVCAGDLYIYTGRNPYVSYPRVGGHEAAGIVTALGEDVSGLKLGARVALDPFIGCGHCYPCRIGKRNCCANLTILGVHRDGGFADFLRAPAVQLHAIPEGLSDFNACFAEPVAIGVQACRRGQVAKGEHILILGAGPIGLAIIEVAQALGATAYITDVNTDRLKIAADFGATPLPAGEALLAEVMAITHGEGMPVVMEATGVAGVMESTIDLVAAGGRIVIVGLVKQGVGVTLPGLDLTRKEVTLLGSRASLDCIPEALGLIASGAIRYPRIAEAMPLAEAPSIFARLAENPSAIHKAVFLSETA